jgi:hypothetical protein
MYKTLSKNLSRGARETCNTSEESRIAQEKKEKRLSTIASLHPGKILPGVVLKKNDYGYVIDIGEVSGSVLTDKLLRIGSDHNFEVIEICLNNIGNTCTKLSLICDNPIHSGPHNMSKRYVKENFESKPFANLKDLLTKHK